MRNANTSQRPITNQRPVTNQRPITNPRPLPDLRDELNLDRFRPENGEIRKEIIYGREMPEYFPRRDPRHERDLRDELQDLYDDRDRMAAEPPNVARRDEHHRDRMGPEPYIARRDNGIEQWDVRVVSPIRVVREPMERREEREPLNMARREPQRDQREPPDVVRREPQHDQREPPDVVRREPQRDQREPPDVVRREEQRDLRDELNDLYEERSRRDVVNVQIPTKRGTVIVVETEEKKKMEVRDMKLVEDLSDEYNPEESGELEDELPRDVERNELPKELPIEKEVVPKVESPERPKPYLNPNPILNPNTHPNPNPNPNSNRNPHDEPERKEK